MAQLSYADYVNQRQTNANAGLDAPLAGLDSSQYSYASFIYPLDLGSPGAGKDHYMVFHINETSTTQFKTSSSSGAAPNSNSADGVPTITSNANRDSANNNSGNAFQGTTGTESTGQDGNDAASTNYSTTRQPIQRVATTIVLYMPNEITANYQADWDKTELGAAADAANLLKGTGSWQDLLKSFGASGLKSAGTMASSFTGTNVSDAASLTSRLVINNHLEVIFNGIGFRQFVFNFRFTPESENEANNIDNIIRAFKFYAAPEILQGQSGRFWIYPAEFDIQYISNGQENQYLNKISTCALTDMQVNYTPTGHFAAHRPASQQTGIQGSPNVCIDIALTFKELEIMTKQRVLEGY